MISRETDTDPRPPSGGPGTPVATAELIEDWITIWQSELAALVLDSETQGTLLRLIDGWATQSRGMLALMTPPGVPRDAGRPAGADAPARAAAAAAAPDERDAVVQQLLARVGELERRLAGPPPPNGNA